MKKLSILSMLLLFISMGNIQAQTVKEESRKQKKAEQELLDQMFFDEAKQAQAHALHEVVTELRPVCIGHTCTFFH